MQKQKRNKKLTFTYLLDGITIEHQAKNVKESMKKFEKELADKIDNKEIKYRVQLFYPTLNFETIIPESEFEDLIDNKNISHFTILEVIK